MDFDCCTRICVYSGHELNILLHIQIALCVVLFHLAISIGYIPAAEHTVDLSMQDSALKSLNAMRGNDLQPPQIERPELKTAAS